MRSLLLSATLLLTLAAAPPSTPVTLSAQPRSALDTQARTLLAQDLAEARGQGDEPLVLVGSARLGASTDRPALFVQLQSARECGSAGCSTAVYVVSKGQWKRVLDGLSGPISVASTRTHGMADLVADTERYAWTGTEYRNVRPAPAVDLRPRQPRQARH